MGGVDEAKLYMVDECFCLPLSLLVNFSLFQYLVGTFYTRRAETRVRMLFVVAFISFASLVPFSYPDVELVHDLNDISETATVMTFLLQINMLARKVSKKIRIRSLVLCARAGEVLVVLGFLLLLANFAQLIDKSVDKVLTEEFDNIYENIATFFVCGFRFYFLGTVKGFKTLWLTHKLEMFYYFLLLTNEYPFMVLDEVTGASWEHVQGIWNRVVIVLCLSSTLKAKFVSSAGSKTKRSTAAGGNSRLSFNPESSAPGPVETSVAKQSRTAKAVSIYVANGDTAFVTATGSQRTFRYSVAVKNGAITVWLEDKRTKTAMYFGKCLSSTNTSDSTSTYQRGFYEFELEPVALDAVDVLESKLRDQDDEIARLSAMLSAQQDEKASLCATVQALSQRLICVRTAAFATMQTTDDVAGGDTLEWKNERGLGFDDLVEIVERGGSLGATRILKSTWLSVSLSIVHKNGLDAEAFHLRRNDLWVVGCYAASHGPWTTSVLTCEVEVDADDVLKVVYTSDHNAYAGSTLTIRVEAVK
ncbi:hypothetical protein PybrP1_006583 [[Pythium] brassicae (nom. inval.)]|nr:hypothetical protein PybrP1_006583 [[Pythium] brassicae (nom. inval.)]